MNPEVDLAFSFLPLTIYLLMGALPAALLARRKGRSMVGWFFIGIFLMAWAVFILAIERPLERDSSKSHMPFFSKKID